MEYLARIELLNGKDVLTRESFDWIDEQREKNAFEVDALVHDKFGDVTTARMLIRWAAVATATEVKDWL